jgi:hypothetical protein
MWADVLQPLTVVQFHAISVAGKKQTYSCRPPAVAVRNSAGFGQKLLSSKFSDSSHSSFPKRFIYRGHFLSDEAASKLQYLVLRNTKKDWKMPQMTWKQAVN